MAKEKYLRLKSSDKKYRLLCEKLQEKLDAEVSHIKSLNSLSSYFNSSLNLETVLSRVCIETAGQLKAAFSCIFLFNQRTKEYYPASHFGLPPGDNLEIYSVESSYFEKLFNDENIFYISNIQKSAENPRLEIYCKHNIKSLLGYKLIFDGNTIGGLFVFDQNEFRDFSPEEIRLLMGISTQAALAINNAILVDDMKKNVELTRSLRSIDKAILRKEPVGQIISYVLNQVKDILENDYADFVRVNFESGKMEHLVSTGLEDEGIGKKISGYWVKCPENTESLGEVLFAPDMSEQYWNRGSFAGYLSSLGFSFLLRVPVIGEGTLLGCLTTAGRQKRNNDPKMIDVMEAFAGQIAVVIQSDRLFRETIKSKQVLEKAYDETLRGWAKALELRDRETEGHSKRVTDITVRLSRIMGIPEEEIIHVRRGAMLHDIGKLGIPDQILLKPGRLEPKEWEQMKRHITFAELILKDIEYLKPAIDIPLYHHEKWDGTGYPRRLKGKEIPLAARIFAVADVWDALISERPYDRIWGQKEALNYILEQSGRHFDPRVVEAFREYIREKGISV